MMLNMSIILLALGSNLGDRAENLARARTLLARSITLHAVSPIYETEPWGVTDQPCFLNQTLLAETDLTPDGLLAFAKEIEAALGRDFSAVRYGPRPIDIDILAYDKLMLNTPRLTIPHQRLHERAFVLVPLNDIAPDWLHPRLNQTVAQMLAQVDGSGVEHWEDSSRKGAETQSDKETKRVRPK